MSQIILVYIKTMHTYLCLLHHLNPDIVHYICHLIILMFRESLEPVMTQYHGKLSTIYFSSSLGDHDEAINFLISIQMKFIMDTHYSETLYNITDSYTALLSALIDNVPIQQLAYQTNIPKKSTHHFKYRRPDIKRFLRIFKRDFIHR